MLQRSDITGARCPRWSTDQCQHRIIVQSGQQHCQDTILQDQHLGEEGKLWSGLDQKIQS